MLLDNSHIQYLHDSNGKPVAVQISIEDWKNIESQVLKEPEMPEWHKPLLDERIKRAKENPESMLDFDSVMKELENEV